MSDSYLEITKYFAFQLIMTKNQALEMSLCSNFWTQVKSFHANNHNSQ